MRTSQTLTSKMIFHFVLLAILFIEHTLCCLIQFIPDTV